MQKIIKATRSRAQRQRKRQSHKRLDLLACWMFFGIKLRPAFEGCSLCQPEGLLCIQLRLWPVARVCRSASRVCATGKPRAASHASGRPKVCSSGRPLVVWRTHERAAEQRDETSSLFLGKYELELTQDTVTTSCDQFVAA